MNCANFSYLIINIFSVFAIVLILLSEVDGRLPMAVLGVLIIAFNIKVHKDYIEWKNKEK